MQNSTHNEEMLLRITAVFPLRNQIELVSLENGKVFYFKFLADQSVQSQLKVGDFLLIKGRRFQVLKKNRNKVQGLSGSLDVTGQLNFLSVFQGA